MIFDISDQNFSIKNMSITDIVRATALRLEHICSAGSNNTNHFEEFLHACQTLQEEYQKKHDISRAGIALAALALRLVSENEKSSSNLTLTLTRRLPIVEDKWLKTPLKKRHLTIVANITPE